VRRLAGARQRPYAEAFVVARLACAVLLLGGVAAASAQDRAVCPDRVAADDYFPKGTLAHDNAKSDAFVREWYGQHLSALGEPSLSCGSPAPTIRFLWLRTFHHPVSVRVTGGDGEPSLVAVELDGAGGYGPGKSLRREATTISRADLAQLQEAVAQADFWALPTSDDAAGLNGAEWILEVADPGRHHVAVRWSPEHGPVHDIALRLLALAKWDIESVY
jgi:hypothetical protein